MKKFLVVVDMQKDFVDGALGTKEAEAIVPAVVKEIEDFDGEIFATLDTHFENYLESAEGKKLPVEHCIKGTDGWKIRPEIAELLKDAKIYEKPTFGSTALAADLTTNTGVEPDLSALLYQDEAAPAVVYFISDIMLC